MGISLKMKLVNIMKSIVKLMDGTLIMNAANFGVKSTYLTGD